MNGMHVFVTGASGFIGSHLIPALLNRGCRVRCLVHPSEWSRLPEFLRRQDVELVRGDILSPPRELQALMHECTHLVHLAGLYSFFAPTRAFHNINVVGTERVMQSAFNIGLRVVHVSTCAVFGRQKDLFNESAQHGKPMSVYAHTKRLADEHVRRLRKRGLRATILYPASVLGARDPQASGKYLRGVADKPWLQGGKGLPMLIFRHRRMTWVHVRDVVDAIAAALVKDEAVNRDFLVGGQVLPFHAINDTVASLRRGLAHHPRLYLPFERLLFVLSLLSSPMFRLFRVAPPWGFTPDQIRTMLAEVRFDGRQAQELLLGRPYTPIEEAIRDFFSS